MASPTYTISSSPTISIGSISGANVGYSNTKWTTGLSGTSAAELNQSGKLILQGTNADIDINGRSLMKTLDALQERLNMMVPNPELEKEWDDLRRLGNRYRKLEAKCKEKAKMWNKLKSMPKPNINL
jgi:flagellar motility protein MotE (MotC chaperone)